MDHPGSCRSGFTGRVINSSSDRHRRPPSSRRSPQGPRVALTIDDNAWPYSVSQGWRRVASLLRGTATPAIAIAVTDRGLWIRRQRAASAPLTARGGVGGYPGSGSQPRRWLMDWGCLHSMGALDVLEQVS